MMTDRFTEALALILKEETGYPQPPGGPYVRLEVDAAWNKRHKARLPEGTYVLDEETGRLRRRGDGWLIDIPRKPDGMAFDDHPRDPGGRTGMGILQREYDAWRKRQDLPTRDVWLIADRELEIIYRRQYWDRCRCEELEPGVGEMTFNTAVNCGVGTAARQLQMVADVDHVDGIIGEVTVAAVNALAAKEAVHALAKMQERRYRSLENFSVFGENWLGRNRRVEVYFAARAQDIEPWHPAVTAAVAEIGEPEVRTARAHEEPPETPAQSTTNQAAAGTSLAGASMPTLKILTIAKQFVAAGKSLLTLEFAFEVITDPEVWVYSMIGFGVVWGSLHIIRERTRRLVTMGV